MENLGFILFAIAAVAAVILFTLRNQEATRAAQLADRNASMEKDLAQLKTDATTRKESLEARTKELAELKEKHRDAKKRLHNEKGTVRKEEIDHARAEAEREAHSQIESARREASEAQTELKRIKMELEISRAKKPRFEAPASEARAAEVRVDLTSPQAPAVPAEPRPPRELTKVEQDRIQLLERQAVKQADRVKLLEEEALRYQRRSEANDKVYRVAKSENELTKSKMTLIEKRLNKTLLELDKLRGVAFKGGMAKEMVIAQAEAEAESAEKEKAAAPVVASALTSPADTQLPAPEAKA